MRITLVWEGISLKIQFGEREFEIDIKIVISVAVAFVCVVTYLFKGNGMTNKKATEVTMISYETAVPSVEKEDEHHSRVQNKEIRVYVKGCVRKQGVYSLESGSLIIDAVDAAGGFTKDANRDFNFVWELKENCVINIPKKGENVGYICTSSLKTNNKSQGAKKWQSRKARIVKKVEVRHRKIQKV